VTELVELLEGRSAVDVSELVRDLNRWRRDRSELALPARMTAAHVKELLDELGLSTNNSGRVAGGIPSDRDSERIARAVRRFRARSTSGQRAAKKRRRRHR
jgi:hypothetical protein